VDEVLEARLKALENAIGTLQSSYSKSTHSGSRVHQPKQSAILTPGQRLKAVSLVLCGLIALYFIESNFSRPVLGIFIGFVLGLSVNLYLFDKQFVNLEPRESETSSQVYASPLNKPKAVEQKKTETPQDDQTIQEIEAWLEELQRRLLSDSDEKEAKTQDSKQNLGDEEAKVCKEADEMLTKRHLSQALQFLQTFLANHPSMASSCAINCRFARYYYLKAKETPNIAETEAQTAIMTGFQHSEKALADNDKDYLPHKWFAILSSEVGRFSSVKIKIQNGHLAKKHILYALQLAPRDAELWHLMGRFHYEVSAISWIQKRAISALGLTPPDGTINEAIQCLEKAYQYRSEWIMNLYWLAQAYLRINERKKAHSFLEQAVKLKNTHCRDFEDRKWIEEVEKLVTTL